ncbi:MAG: substrate-binding domain-containing protein [Deltaproteobacteria bacterium]|nr:substrate-binding domain-containing protein [Deltaproteobacteria bacterium]
MNKRNSLFSFILAFLTLLNFTSAHAETRLRMSTTTSTENSGLLKVLLPPFEKSCDCKVDVIAVGTGKALKLGETGDVDVVFVHARELEEKFVADGFGVNRKDVMYNDFVIIGPSSDPAGVKEVRTAAEAFSTISAKNAVFISRGDESGTHQKEKEIWEVAGGIPKGSWYVEAGQGMGEVINMATERQGYTLADRGTYIAYKKKSDLVLLYEGDKALFNPYGVIAVNPKKHPHVKYDLAMKLIEFLISKEGQGIIANFNVNGEQLFFPDAR